MSTNIKKIKKMERGINYIVKPEIGLVVCILRDNPWTSWRGSAKCSPDDTFDEEKGKRIAFLRACAKRKRYILKDVRETVEIFDQDIRESEERKRKAMKAIDSIKKSLCSFAEEIHKLGN